MEDGQCFAVWAGVGREEQPAAPVLGPVRGEGEGLDLDGAVGEEGAAAVDRRALADLDVGDAELAAARVEAAPALGRPAAEGEPLDDEPVYALGGDHRAEATPVQDGARPLAQDGHVVGAHLDVHLRRHPAEQEGAGLLEDEAAGELGGDVLEVPLIGVKGRYARVHARVGVVTVQLGGDAVAVLIHRLVWVHRLLFLLRGLGLGVLLRGRLGAGRAEGGEAEGRQEAGERGAERGAGRRAHGGSSQRGCPGEGSSRRAPRPGDAPLYIGAAPKGSFHHLTDPFILEGGSRKWGSGRPSRPVRCARTGLEVRGPTPTLRRPPRRCGR